MTVPLPTSRTVLLLAVLAVGATQIGAQETGTTTAEACRPAAFDSTTPTALVNATLIDGTGAPPQPGMTILITGEHIVDVFPTGSKMMIATTMPIDLEGRYVIPGLIDSHAHVATDPAGEDTRVRTERRLCNALLGGVTTVRDMAGDVRALASLARDALVSDIVSPDIQYVALFASPAFFEDPRAGAASAGATAGALPWMRGITDSTDLRQAVAEARGTGASAIKVYFGLDAPLLDRTVAEAHRQGLPVWSHLTVRPAQPIEVVESGADVVSHAPLLAFALGPRRARALMNGDSGAAADLDDPAIERVLAAMADRGTIFEPTLFVYQDRPAVLGVSGELVRLADQAGVTISAGTDSLAGADGDLVTLPNIHREMQLLVEHGSLSPIRALDAATRIGAMAANVLESRGTVERGKLADLVVLEADPTVNIRNTELIEIVIKRGRVYSRASSTIGAPHE
jgi:imidazolonepropionase-like amidohydrolase